MFYTGRKLVGLVILGAVMGTYSVPDTSFVDLYMGGIERPDVLLDVNKTVFDPNNFNFQAMIKLIKNPFTALVPLPVTDYETHHLIAEHLYQALHKHESEIISSTTQRDLVMFGNAATKKYSLVRRVMQPLTVCGDVFSTFTVANPIDDVERLSARQAVIKMLLEHEDMLQSIEKSLKEFAQYESLVADFWKNESNANFHKMLLGQVYMSKAYPFLGFLDRSSWLNNLSYLYSIGSIPLQFVGLEPISSINGFMTRQMMTFNYKNMIVGLSEHIKNTYVGDYMTVGGGMFVLKNLLIPSVFVNDMFTDGVLNGDKVMTYIGFGIWQTYMTWVITKRIAHQKKIYNFLHEKMNKVAVMVRVMKKFYTYLQFYPELAHNLEHGYLLNKYFGKDADISSQLKQLLQLLETDTFTTNSMWSMRGRVKTAYRLFEEVKAELVDGFIAIGEIDTYAAAARAYKERKDTGQPLTFATYITHSATPIINVKNMWNPLVIKDVIVGNSLTLGVEGNPRNIILTGPNAGGKTTFLKGIMIDIIFAQTLGIAPAQSLECTLFNKMNAYLNIVDNILEDESRAEAEVARSAELRAHMENNQQKGKFTLSIIDELLSGAEPAAAMASSYAVSKKLGSINTGVTLIATHFVDTMSKLESDTGLFKNYKVEASVKPDGSIDYPFLIVPGISTSNVLDAILHKAGFDENVMQDFYAQLGHA